MMFVFVCFVYSLLYFFFRACPLRLVPLLYRRVVASLLCYSGRKAKQINGCCFARKQASKQATSWLAAIVARREMRASSSGGRKDLSSQAGL